MIKRFLIIGFLSSLLSEYTIASYYSIDNRLFFENFSLDEKLVHSHVLSIFQDSTGYLWIGTYGGLQLFNGFNFSEFQIGMIKQTDLSSNYVLVTYEDRDRNLWFGTDVGLFHYDRTKDELMVFKHDANNPLSISDNRVRTIYEDEQGIFWIGTYGGGVNKLNLKNNSFERFTSKSGDPSALQSDMINKFFVDADGLFWIGTEHGGISIFDKSVSRVTKSFTKANSNLSDSTINDIFQDIYGTIWVGTWNGGLNKYIAKENRFISYQHNSSQPTSLNCNTVRAIKQADENHLWIATFGGGLSRFNIQNEQFQKIEINTTKRKNSSWEFLWTLYKDREGNLWVGTFGAGLMKLDKLRGTFPSYSLVNRRNGNVLGISSVIEDTDRKIWLGTLDDGIHIFNRKTNDYADYDMLEDKYITVLYKDRSNRIWIGTSNGLYLIKADRRNVNNFLVNRRKPDGMSLKTVSCILEDRAGNIWIGFYGGGINLIRKDQVSKFHPSEIKVEKFFIDENNKSSINNIWVITEDRKGHIWIGNSDKLIYYTPSTEKFNFLPILDVSTIYEDEAGYFWMGALGTGFYKLDANFKVLKHYRIEEGLPELVVVGVLVDDKGKLWIATAKGITEFDTENETFINYGLNYGLQGGFYSLNCQTKLTSGEMFFGGNNGFNIFDPKVINRQIIYPKVVISDIKLNYKSILLDHSNDTTAKINIFSSNIADIRTKKNTRTISIEFAALNYSISKEIVYSYYLEGYDEDWIITGADNRRATYTNLDGGKYIFKVRASSEKGSWSDQVTSLQIEVQSPLWKTWWFRGPLILLIIILLAYYFSLRVKELKKEISFYKDKNISENLIKEQEILILKNEELAQQLSEKGKQLASMAVDKVEYSDWLSSIYTRLMEMKSNASSMNLPKFNQILTLFERKAKLSQQPNYNENFDLIYENFTKRFAEAYPRITHKDLKICSYIRMNKSNKEIADLLNITLRSLEISRYRIRKKMGLSNAQNLNDFILRF